MFGEHQKKNLLVGVWLAGMNELMDDPVDLGIFIGLDATMRKRERDAKLVFNGQDLVELFVGDPTAEVWKHKTLYCLQEKQDEEVHKSRFWVDWRAGGAASQSLRQGRVVVFVRQREWKPKEPQYRLKQLKDEDLNGWRAFSVTPAGEEKKKKGDAANITVVFRGQTMTLQDMADILSSQK